MTQAPNVKGEHVQYVKSVLERLDASFYLNKFLGTNNEWYRRHQCERIVANDSYRRYHEEYFTGPYTVNGLRYWLSTIEEIEKESGLPAAIDTEEDEGRILAVWVVEVPYTEEEKKAAQKWLDDNPTGGEPATIKFRITTNTYATGETKHDDDDNEEYI